MSIKSGCLRDNSDGNGKLRPIRPEQPVSYIATDEVLHDLKIWVCSSIQSIPVQLSLSLCHLQSLSS